MSNKITQESYVLDLLNQLPFVSAIRLYNAGIASPQKVISNLRAKGNCIYSARTEDKTVNWTLGRPTAALIAAVHHVYGAKYFKL